MNDRLSFYDLRKPELLVYACCFEGEEAKRKGNTSLQICDNRSVITNNMSNQVVEYRLSDVTEEPRVYTGHRSTFFAKASSYDGVIACGSQDRMVYVWAGSKATRLGREDRLGGHLHEVNDVCVTANHILSTSDDASVLIWKLT